MVDNTSKDVVRVSQEFGFGRYKMTMNCFNENRYVHIADDKKNKFISMGVEDFEEMLRLTPAFVETGKTMPLKKVSSYNIYFII